MTIHLKQVFTALVGILWSDDHVADNLNKFSEPRRFIKYGWVYSLYKYKDEAVRSAIWQMKFRGNKNVAKIFGKFLAELIKKENLENYIVVPIPIHWRRRMERGFNQTEWLCEYIKKYSNGKIKIEKVLKRVIYSQKQSWNSRGARQENIKSVFKVRNKISGKKFLIIDDVVTTGATLKEARRELLIHGATSVKALTIAC